jgi:UDP-N-acetylmuramate: L-alanyl-gamma-D-glutamyl-meso-diaminopimelate ligase
MEAGPLERVPEGVRRIHVLGVAGTGMGSFAGLLKTAGFEVTGSDENVYPPMSDVLAGLGIQVMTPYAAANLDAARPDLVVVGNVIRRVNPEATAMRERGLPHVSFPQALEQLFLATRHSVVIAGTHGKTTTTSLTAHLLAACGRDPSLLVGGVAGNFGGSYRLGRGEEFVVEGDEYDTAYFDKGPKFLHYAPRTVIFTSCELDHADIYRDTAHYESAFEKLMALLPPDGTVLACASTEPPPRIARTARCPVETYSAAGVDAHWTATDLRAGPEGTRFVVRREGRPLLEALLPLGGRHNVENALAAAAVALHRGGAVEDVARGLGSFAGVRRRQELRGEPGGVAVIDDFAHHPTAVRETIAAVAGRFPGRRLVAVFEPRSNTSRRSLHQAEYARSFGGAALALLSTPVRTDQVPDDEQLDVQQLCADIAAAGTPARAFAGPADIVAHLAREARAGDVILAMSNGAFGGFVGKLLAALEARG